MKLFFVTFLFLYLNCRITLASQVHMQDSDQTLADIYKNSAHALEVKYLNKNEIIKEVKFPKETHYKKAEETIYRDSAGLYKIVRVLKSKTLKKGKTIKIWQEPAYDEYLMRRYHEEGISKSPIVLVYKSKFKIKNPNHMIVFINDKEVEKDIYQLVGEEDLSAAAEIKKIK